MKHALKQMKYRYAEMNETPSTLKQGQTVHRSEDIDRQIKRQTDKKKN